MTISTALALRVRARAYVGRIIRCRGIGYAHVIGSDRASPMLVPTLLEWMDGANNSSYPVGGRHSYQLNLSQIACAGYARVRRGRVRRAPACPGRLVGRRFGNVAATQNPAREESRASNRFGASQDARRPRRCAMVE